MCLLAKKWVSQMNILQGFWAHEQVVLFFPCVNEVNSG